MALVPPNPRSRSGRTGTRGRAERAGGGAARSALSPVESCPVAALLRAPTGATDFEGLFAGLDPALPAEHRVLADTFWFARPAMKVAAEIARAHDDAPSPKALTILTFVGGDERPGEIAFAAHTGVTGLCYAVWDSESDDAVNRAWHDRAVAALEPLASAHYIGEADLRRPRTLLHRRHLASSRGRREAIRPRGNVRGAPLTIAFLRRALACSAGVPAPAAHRP